MESVISSHCSKVVSSHVTHRSLTEAKFYCCLKYVTIRARLTKIQGKNNACQSDVWSLCCRLVEKNPCGVKSRISDCSEHLVSDSLVFFFFLLLLSLCNVSERVYHRYRDLRHAVAVCTETPPSCSKLRWKLVYSDGERAKSILLRRSIKWIHLFLTGNKSCLGDLKWKALWSPH